jgi:cation diffusion facilitator family transporter
MFSSPSSAAKLSLAVIVGLIALKVMVAVITGSISIVAQAMDSLLDLFAVVITVLAIRIATKPADEEHPFGHGKAENIAAVLQAALIFAAGALIIYAAVHRIIAETIVELTGAGIGVMLASIIASILLSRHLRRVAKATGSIALEANAHNIAADAYSAAAVLAGLLVIRFIEPDIQWIALGKIWRAQTLIDPVIALIVALFILKVAYDVLRKSFGGLVDTRLPQQEENEIKAAIMQHGCLLGGFHDLRTRQAGRQRYVELHLVMPRNASVDITHRMCDNLEQDIEKRLPNTSITIHVEPGDMDCDQCSVSCTIKNEAD